MYSKGDMCVATENERKSIERLRRAGVPSNLLHATLDNWQPNSNDDRSNLEMVKAFAQTRCGFLVMLGDLGTGKSHLAVGLARQFKSPMYITQGELLRRLRSCYRDKTAIDPVDQAQQADLLILDEMGLSAGGRDEMPMLHDILTHRYNERKPTILTGNISLDQLKSLIGERMTDRLKESAYPILIFGGTSYRIEARKRYFQDNEI
jgi:DNA replication protein DnaC